ncbi:DUF6507 family protein [Streptomonospora wellingtoniae]|uniref:DUF6507 family protein n=1 Tax=Streptomonospora wellingtoniae TaxID=3075544 RepID=A0ABU2KYC7_9ACTN|nr:DUF6507 family protein [Streptomonospora sp. DSM 45055]MDT0304211.1 DUF6507 family protein [Streptomonospora sp. DSM 45055]
MHGRRHEGSGADVPGWDLKPEEISGVLTTVAGHIGDEEQTEGLSLHSKSLGTALDDAGAAAKSAPIGTALQEFSTHCFGLVKDMVGLGSSAVKGAGDAAMHYVNGNLDMAAEAQSNAGTVEDP